MYLIGGYAPIHPFLEHFFLKIFPVSFSVTVRFNKKLILFSYLSCVPFESFICVKLLNSEIKFWHHQKERNERKVQQS